MISVPLSGYQHFSSSVRLSLRVREQTFELAAIGPDEIFPRVGLDLNPCEADIVMEVDGQCVSWPVALEQGAVPFERAIRIAPRGDIQRAAN